MLRALPAAALFSVAAAAEPPRLAPAREAPARGWIACGGGAAETRQPPLSGENFQVYCRPCAAAGRTFGRTEMIHALVESFAELARWAPETTFVYGEIGLRDGGPFPPHRTHRDGLSLDVMAPLIGGAPLPTHLGNRFGYDVEFDAHGRGEARTIDFEALGRHLLALDTAARRHGGRIRRVLLAPDLQDDLARTTSGAQALARLTFNRRQTWVRHDDHYHVDFSFPCPQ